MMPPKDIKAGRKNGRHVIFTESGYQPLGVVQEVEITEETGTLECLNEAFTSLGAATEIMVEAWNRLWETLNPMLDRLAKDQRIPRLKHLAQYGKNRRIRKKNAKRLVSIMKGE